MSCIQTADEQSINSVATVAQKKVDFLQNEAISIR